MTKTQLRDKRKNAKRPQIRITAEMKERLERLRDGFQESYEAGRINLPDGIDCEAIPLWYVIDRALDELEDHRERSRRSSRKK